MLPGSAGKSEYQTDSQTRDCEGVGKRVGFQVSEEEANQKPAQHADAGRIQGWPEEKRASSPC